MGRPQDDLHINKPDNLPTGTIDYQRINKPIVSVNTILLLLLLLTTVLYARTLHYSFVSDDWSQIVFNQRIQSWHNFPDLFARHLWAQQLSAAHGNYYRPLLLVWMLVNYAMVGPNAAGWHATSLVLQLLAGLLVWRTALAITGDFRAAIVATAIFLLHPLAVESTVCISDANDPLCLIFLLTSFLVFLNRQRWRAWMACTISLMLYALALLTKEIAVGFCAVIFIYEVLYRAAGAREHSRRRALQAAAPYAGVAILYLAVRRLAIGTTIVQATPAASVSTFFLTLPSVLWTYLHHFFVPVNLAIYYDTPYVQHAGSRQFLLPIVAIVAVGGVLYMSWRRTRSRALLLGLAWSLLMLAAPLYGTAYFGKLGLVHDRYFYPALAGIGISVGAVVGPYLRRRPVAIAAAALAITLVVLSFQQQVYWKDNEALFSRATEVAPNTAIPYLVMAGIRDSQGRTKEAATLAKHAFAIEPDALPSLTFAASMADRAGKTAEEEALLETAITRYPSRPEPHVMLAQLRFRQSRSEEAFAEFNKAVDLFPDNLNYRLDLARAYLGQNNVRSALAEYKSALAIAPQESGLRSLIDRLELREADDSAAGE